MQKPVTIKVRVNGEPTDVTITDSEFSVAEARSIQKLTGKTFGDWYRTFRSGDVDAAEAGALVLVRREHPAVAADDLLCKVTDLWDVLVPDEIKPENDAEEGTERRPSDGEAQDPSAAA